MAQNPALAPLELSTINSIIEDETNRLRSYKMAWNAYYGKWPDSLNVKPGQPNDNVKLNLCRLVVDKGAFYLFGKDIKFSIEDSQAVTLSEKPAADDEATMWLSALWRKQQQQSMLTKLAINGAVCGHAFVKIVPADPFPRLIVLDPSTVAVASDPQDFDKVLGYRIQYNSIDPVSNRPIVIRQLITKNADDEFWTITDQVADVAGGVFALDGGYNNGTNWRTVAVTLWEYDWPPIADTQNLPAPNQYYGTPELTPDLIHLASVVNGVLSNRNRVVRLKGHPITWGKGFGAGQLDLSPEQTLIIRSDSGEIRHLEMLSDMKPATELYDDLIQSFLQQSHIPPIAMGELTTFGNISGLALKIAYGPLVDITDVKRRQYGYMLEDINARLVELKFGKKGLNTVIHWPDILPTDDLSQGQSFQIDETLGASLDTLLSRRGYDAQFELARRKEEIAAGTAPPLASMPSTAKGQGLPGDMRTAENQAEEPDSASRRRSDRKKSD